MLAHSLLLQFPFIMQSFKSHDCNATKPSESRLNQENHNQQPAQAFIWREQPYSGVPQCSWPWAACWPRTPCCPCALVSCGPRRGAEPGRRRRWWASGPACWNSAACLTARPAPETSSRLSGAEWEATSCLRAKKGFQPFSRMKLLTFHLSFRASHMTRYVGTNDIVFLRFCSLIHKNTTI